MKEIVKLLAERNKTIASMESCTGGAFANMVTNIEGASDVLKFSAVTYSNEYKIKMGVDKKTIDKYSVYSIETARSMSLNITDYANADYGIGITGKLNREDKNNLHSSNNDVFVSIYDKENNNYYDIFIKVKKNTREKNKMIIIDAIVSKFTKILNKKTSL